MDFQLYIHCQQAHLVERVSFETTVIEMLLTRLSYKTTGAIKWTHWLNNDSYLIITWFFK